MYLDYYNLKEFPFNITPDPKFLYFTGHHREAFDHLVYGITQRKGFIQLTGEVGSGKTTLCRAVLNHLAQQVETALILNPSLDYVQLLRAILHDFGVKDPGHDQLDCIETLNRYLLKKRRQNQIVAVLIDEAQDLSPDMMEQVRLLSNLETDQHKLLQIVMCGQPELQERLDSRELRQLRQRITVRYHLSPLSRVETESYIDYRLTVAGSDGRIRFDAGAIRAVHRYTGGCPRMINNLCDNALLAGYVEDTWSINARCVKKAHRQLGGRR